MKSKYYFNGYYLVKGVKIFGKIVGRVIYSNTTVYSVNQKVTLSVETFSEVNEDMVKTLKNFGYFSILDL
jgi:hypothetical protein